MAFYARNGDRSVKLEGFEKVLGSLNYNPFNVGKGIVGFYLKGDRVFPVVDLQERLNLSRKSKKLYLMSKNAVFIFEYDSIGKEGEKELDIVEIEREVMEELNRDG
jgi:hypothetical protein